MAREHIKFIPRDRVSTQFFKTFVRHTPHGALIGSRVHNCVELLEIHLFPHVARQLFDVLVRQKPVAVLSTTPPTHIVSAAASKRGLASWGGEPDQQLRKLCDHPPAAPQLPVHSAFNLQRQH